MPLNKKINVKHENVLIPVTYKLLNFFINKKILKSLRK